MSELRQFKLSNGDEVICEVVEWDDDHVSDVIVRNAMAIVSFETRGEKFYTFRPWMVYQLDSQHFQSLNSYHVVSSALPAQDLVKEYKKAVLIENDKEEKNIETLIEKLKDQLMSVHEDNEDMLDSSYDSGLDNVISVKFDKSKLH